MGAGRQLLSQAGEEVGGGGEAVLLTAHLDRYFVRHPFRPGVNLHFLHNLVSTSGRFVNPGIDTPHAGRPAKVFAHVFSNPAIGKPVKIHIYRRPDLLRCGVMASTGILPGRVDTGPGTPASLAPRPCLTLTGRTAIVTHTFRLLSAQSWHLVRPGWASFAQVLQRPAVCRVSVGHNVLYLT